MEYILIFISAIFVNNIILSQFLGICPFLGVSKKVSTSLGMSAAVAFVLTLATIVTYLVQKYVLDLQPWTELHQTFCVKLNAYWKRSFLHCLAKTILLPVVLKQS